MNYLVSIAIASYNNAPYLERCVNSVLTQTYNNLDVIIVDDGSKDESLEKLEQFKSDKRVRVVAKNNGGLSSVRQAALEIAKGEYISFIDGDDYLLPNYVETMLRKILQDMSDVCVCSTRFEGENGVISEKSTTEWGCETSTSVIKTTPSLLSDINNSKLGQLHLSDSWNKMYKIAAIKKCGLKFCMQRGLNGSDTLFNMVLAIHSLNYSTVSTICYVHVIYSRSAVHRKSKNLNATFRIIVQSMVEESKKLGCFEELKYVFSRHWYLFQEEIFGDIHDSIGKRWTDVISDFKILKSDQLYFAKENGLMKCSIRMANSCSSMLFLILFKYAVILMPSYFAFMKHHRQ